MPKTIDEPFSKAKQTCFRLLKIRPRSRQELQERLTQKNYSPEVIAKVVAVLTGLKLIDDRRFAHDWVSWRLTNSYGKHRIIAELKQKGINDTLITETLNNALTDYNEERIARDLAKKRIHRYHNLETST